MTEWPSGTVTFLFTDLQGSTRLWEANPEAMKNALARHDEILRDAVAVHEGYVVKSTGDGLHAVFARAHDAVDAAVVMQRGLAAEGFREIGQLRVRMGVHTCEAEFRDGDYYGSGVNRAARLMGVAHGGQIVCSAASADLARDGLGEGVSFVDLGEHRLRDLSRADRVFQVSAPGLQHEFPRLASMDAFPGNLPLQVTEFVGRDSELVELAKLLGRSRLVTLTGSGGVGKTRLAIQAAAAAVPDYPDGAWFVDLAPTDDESFVATEIATSMGLPEYRQGDREEALVGALAHRHALVVVDNCEHLVEAVARVVDLIVRRCPAVTVLATSQEALEVDGEVTFTVRPLRDDDAEQLFVERAEAARHDFAITTDTTDTVVELCRRLDGIPLAIELAAARVASMSPAAILERIDERFRLLGQGRRTARRRHQTLRAAVDWSYGLLSPPEQVVFARLAIFAGDFTLDAAEAVVADDDISAFDVVDVVSGLVAKSMVQLDAGAGGDRYRLLETMRDYGLERLAERGDLDGYQQRHMAHYLELVEAAAPHFVGRDDTLWVRRVDADYANVRAALLFSQGHDPSVFVRMVHALAWFWSTVFRFREGLAWLTAAQAMAPDATGAAAAEALALAGLMAIDLTRWQHGHDLLQASLDCSTASDDAPRAIALTTLGLAAHIQNRPEDTRRYCEDAVSIARERGDPFELAYTLAMAGTHTALAHDEARGIQLADEGVELARPLGNDWTLVVAIEAAGNTRVRREPARAVELLQESFDLPTARSAASRGVARFMKAVAHLALGEDQNAAAELIRAIPIAQEAGEEYYIAMELASAAVLLRRHNRPEIAVRVLALNERLRNEGRIFGSPPDLASQERLKARLQRETQPDMFEILSTEGRAMTLNSAVDAVLDALAPIANTG
jgi:predicted ATPase/class 3 adenylate cyclase